MALDHYGVLAGTLNRHFRDRPNNQGRWFHVNLEVDAPAGRYRCAIDVDSKNSAVGVQWKVLVRGASALYGGADRPAGYTELARTPGSGALDFHRHPALRPRRWPGPAWLRRLLEWIFRQVRWTAGSNLEAATALEAVLAVGARVLVFGEPFEDGLGVHNVHQNQGDPAGSQWWDENGIWQDGAVAVLRADGRYDLFLSKFSTQAEHTDDGGHPA